MYNQQQCSPPFPFALMRTFSDPMSNRNEENEQEKKTRRDERKMFEKYRERRWKTTRKE